jgi:hypothetical protein
MSRKRVEIDPAELAAKNTFVMENGNFSTDSFKIDGNTLTLVPKAARDGLPPNPATVKLTRVE